MLRNYFKIAVKVLLRRKFYTVVSLFGIAFTLLVLALCAPAPNTKTRAADRLSA